MWRARYSRVWIGPARKGSIRSLSLVGIVFLCNLGFVVSRVERNFIGTLNEMWIDSLWVKGSDSRGGEQGRCRRTQILLHNNEIHDKKRSAAARSVNTDHEGIRPRQFICLERL